MFLLAILLIILHVGIALYLVHEYSRGDDSLLLISGLLANTFAAGFWAFTLYLTS